MSVVLWYSPCGPSGTPCPKCDNSSVFSKKITKWWGLKTIGTEYACEMEYCDYKKTINKEMKVNSS